MIQSSFPNQVSELSAVDHAFLKSQRFLKDGTSISPVVYPSVLLRSIDKAHGAYHWAFERAISVALIPLTIAPFAAGSLNPVTDAVFAAALIIHSHIGFESCVIDYIPTRKYGSFAKIMGWVLKIATGLTFGKHRRACLIHSARRIFR